MFSTHEARALFRMDCWTAQRYDQQDDYRRWVQAWLEGYCLRRSALYRVQQRMRWGW